MTKATKNMKREERRARWTEILKRYEKHEGTVSSFCEKEGVRVVSFYQWRKKLGQTQQPGFVELCTGSETGDVGTVRLLLPGRGVELQLPAHWNAEQVAVLINALQPC